MEKLQVAIICSPETVAWIRRSSKEQGLTMGKLVGAFLDQVHSEQSPDELQQPAQGSTGTSPSPSSPEGAQRRSEAAQGSTGTSPSPSSPEGAQRRSEAAQGAAGTSPSPSSPEGAQRRSEAAQGAAGTSPSPSAPDEAAHGADWTKSDPEALQVLLDGMDEHLRTEEPSYTQRLQEALLRLRNPGDFLDSEAESAVEACGRLAESGLSAINDARQARHKIIASWGENMANLILNIDEHERELAECGPRKTRAMRRKIAMLRESLAEFRRKIRADQRKDANIPSTVEGAEKLLARRDGKRPSFIVLQGSKKVS